MTYNQSKNLLLENHNRLHRTTAGHPFNPECAYCGNGLLHPDCNLTSVDRCIEYITGKKPQPKRPRQDPPAAYALPEWPGHKQQESLLRWNEWLATINLSLGEAGLDLPLISNLLPDYFFSGPWLNLKHQIDVQWIDFKPNPSSHRCRTSKVNSPGDNLPRASIKVMKPDPTKPWTGETLLQLLGTLLHEMGHAFLMCCSCNCADCRCPVTSSRTIGLTGHGPSWVKLCQAVEAEATGKLRGLPGRWDLGCRQQHGPWLERERRALEAFEKRDLVGVELDRRGAGGSGSQ